MRLTLDIRKFLGSHDYMRFNSVVLGLGIIGLSMNPISLCFSKLVCGATLGLCLYLKSAIKSCLIAHLHKLHNKYQAIK